MHRTLRSLMLPALALAGCTAGQDRPTGAGIQTDGQGLFVAAAREAASSTGVLLAHHEAAEEARTFCEDHQRRLLLLGPLVDDDGSTDKVVVLVRFRCAGAAVVGQALP